MVAASVVARGVRGRRSMCVDALHSHPFLYPTPSPNPQPRSPQTTTPHSPTQPPRTQVAGLVGDAILGGVVIHQPVPAALAAAGVPAVNHVLHREVGGRPGGAAADVVAVGQR